jgi:butyrate kinase
MSDAEPVPYERLSCVVDLVDIAGKMKASTVVIAGGHRTEDLQLVDSARDHGIVDRIILVGDTKLISRSVSDAGINIPGEDIILADTDEETAAATVHLIKQGVIDIVLKGGISTPVINRHMLQVAVRPTVSLASIFDASPIADGRPMILTDAGVTTVCNYGRLADIVGNSVEVARVVMGIARPRVAVLSANEKQIPSLQSTWLASKLTEREWPNAVLYGPLSFDLATDPGSVAVKGLPGSAAAREVAGQADILICPGIDAANILYKTITAMTKYGQASLAGITVGFRVPYIILSRADTLETRLNSIALCSIYAQRRAVAAEKGARPEKKKEKTFKVLVVNPGSTSIKVAFYENASSVHESEGPFEKAVAMDPLVRDRQIHKLTDHVTGLLDSWGETHVDAIAARGGFVPRPPQKLPSGTYVVADKRNGNIVVDEALISEVRDHPEKWHASNLGPPVAAALAHRLDAPAYIVDPVVVDEFIPEAEISGYAPVVRKSTSHALSVRAAAKKAAQAAGRSMEDINLVVAHLGGGITVAALQKGRMIDNNIALLGGGPFTPQRAGSLPLDALIDLCFSGRFTRDELLLELTKRGGLISYLGEHRMEVIEKRIAAGDSKASLVVETMVYQIAKEIGAMYTAAGCDVEAIVLTGGLARCKLVRDSLRRRVIRLAPVMVFEGSLEMEALAAGVVDVLSGKEQPRLYGHLLDSGYPG